MRLHAAPSGLHRCDPSPGFIKTGFIELNRHIQALYFS